jgi:hypothetical protein
LDLDPIIDKYGELPSQQLEDIGWAEHCDHHIKKTNNTLLHLQRT